jgi:ComF family protein
MLSAISRIFLDLLFPWKCVACRANSYLLCSQCAQELRPAAALSTFNTPFTSLSASFAYEKTAKALVRAVKFEGLLATAEIMGKLMADHLPRPPDTALLTAIPLHPSRQSERGYNQSELIARQLAREWQLPYAEVLEKCLPTVAQMTLTKAERETQVSGVYTAKQLALPAGTTHLVLLDDVITTGSTLKATGECLQQAYPHLTLLGIGFAHGD